MAIEIVDFPMKNGLIFHGKLLNDQRVITIKSHEIPLNHHFPMVFLWFSYKLGNLGSFGSPITLETSTQVGGEIWKISKASVPAASCQEVYPHVAWRGPWQNLSSADLIAASSSDQWVKAINSMGDLQDPKMEVR